MFNTTINDYKLILQNITLINSDNIQHELTDSKYICIYTMLINDIMLKERKVTYL